MYVPPVRPSTVANSNTLQPSGSMGGRKILELLEFVLMLSLLFFFFSALQFLFSRWSRRLLLGHLRGGFLRERFSRV